MADTPVGSGHHFGDGCRLEQPSRKPWSPVVTQGDHWAQYRLQLDITDLIRLRHALRVYLTRSDPFAYGPMYDLYLQLNKEVRALPADHLELIRQEQPK